MPSKSKKILVTRKSREVLIVRRKNKDHGRGVCDECQTEVEMLTLDSAVNLSGISVRRLMQLAERGELHFRETESGNLFLCGLSLKRFSNP